LWLLGRDGQLIEELMLKIIPLAVLIMSLLGCSQMSRERHPWQSAGGPYSFTIDTTQWAYVELERLGRVEAEYISEACALLKEADAVEITPAKAKKMCPNAKFDFSGSLKPFLIRGVSYGKPAYSIVKFDKQTGWVYFLQTAYTGELYFPGGYSPMPAPIVILLEYKPVKVVAAANVGGDAVLRSIDLLMVWDETNPDLLPDVPF